MAQKYRYFTKKGLWGYEDSNYVFEKDVNNIPDLKKVYIPEGTELFKKSDIYLYTKSGNFACTINSKNYNLYVQKKLIDRFSLLINLDDCGLSGQLFDSNDGIYTKVSIKNDNIPDTREDCIKEILKLIKHKGKKPTTKDQHQQKKKLYLMSEDKTENYGVIGSPYTGIKGMQFYIGDKVLVFDKENFVLKEAYVTKNCIMGFAGYENNPNTIYKLKDSYKNLKVDDLLSDWIQNYKVRLI